VVVILRPIIVVVVVVVVVRGDHAEHDDHGDIDSAADQETRKGRISMFCFARCYAGLPMRSYLCLSVRNMQVPVRIFLEICFSAVAVN
jgi:hypothetical protein